MQEDFYKGAISHFNFAEEILSENKFEDVNIHKELYSKMAYCYIKLDNPNMSLKYIEKINEIDNRNDRKEDVDILVLKANNMLEIGKYEESRDYFKKALKILESEDNKTGLANVYLTICDVYRKIGETDRVLEYSQKVYDIKKNDEDEYMMSGLFKIIEAYIDKEDYDLARKYCKIALASSIKNKNKFNEYKALRFYANMYKNQNEVTLAIEYLIKCIKIVSDLGNNRILANLYIDLGQLYSNISKEKELEYYQKVYLCTKI